MIKWPNGGGNQPLQIFAYRVFILQDKNIQAMLFFRENVGLMCIIILLLYETRKL